jgi:HEPN domain-containing protein
MVDMQVVQRWKQGAHEEWESAELLYRNEHLTQALFHCHLAVEKILKAQYMLENDKEPPYAHNLVVLARKLRRMWTEDEEHDLGRLSQFCEQSRYGDELWLESTATAESVQFWLERSKYFISLFT